MQRAAAESNYLEPTQRALVSITPQRADSKTSKLDAAFIYVAGGGGGGVRFCWGLGGGGWGEGVLTIIKVHSAQLSAIRCNFEGPK